MEVKATINGKEETLKGIEAEIYLKQGEKAIINRRQYCKENYNFLSSLYYERALSQFTPRNTKDTITYKISEDNYD